MNIRTYFDKQATLISENNTNNSKNPVLEIVRGENLYSRYIFSIDLNKLRDKIDSYGFSETIVTNHKIVFYNTIRYREDLIGKQNVDGFLRENNVELKLFSFDENFADGVKFDYQYTKNLVPDDTYVPNWYFKNKNDRWDVDGVYSGDTANIIDTTILEDGSQNITFDVTNHINNLLFNLSASTANLGLSYGNDYEYSISGDNIFIISFFSKETQTFFEPFLETTVNDVIIDKRNEFYIGEENELYLYSTKPLDSVDFVDIYDDQDNLFTTISGSSIEQVNSLVYRIKLTVGNNYPDMINFIDKWEYTINGNTDHYENSFTLLKRDLFSSQENVYQNAEYYFGVVGLFNGEKISPSVKTKRVQVTSKRMFNSSIELETPNEFIEYRIYVKQGNTQIDIVPYTKVSKTFYNNYFDLDIESFIPQIYYLEFRVNRNNIIINNGDVIKFTVVSEKM